MNHTNIASLKRVMCCTCLMSHGGKKQYMRMRKMVTRVSNHTVANIWNCCKDQPICGEVHQVIFQCRVNYLRQDHISHDPKN